jgi:hypothetical protein
MKPIVFRERVTRIDGFAMAFNPHVLENGQKVADLECGHKALARLGAKTVACLRCAEMMRRSLLGLGEDYEAYRHGGKPDRMVWPDDPCRIFHESHDIEGTFDNDPAPPAKPFTT